jgi:heptosyltransferase-2
MAAPHGEPGRVVVWPPNWLGDAVLSLPAIAGIRRHFAKSRLTIAAAPAVASLFREEIDARPDTVIELPDRGRATRTTLAAGGFDVGILLPNSFRSAWLLRRAGVPGRWGAATSGRGWLLTRQSPRPPRGLHQADYYRAIVRGLDIGVDDAPPVLRPSAASAAAAAALLAKLEVPAGTPLVGFAPGAAYGQAKQWPPDRVAAVIARLVRDHGAACVVLGAAHDRPASRAIESWLRAQAPETRRRVADLVGRTDLGALVGVAARCAVFVSNDSGAMHVAAAAGSAVVALFGPTDARATGPLGTHDVLTAPAFCRPCHLRDCPIDHRCMKRISVDAVFAAAAARLAHAPV